MITILIACSIGLPWIGALLVWLIGDKREKAQHWLSILFSVAAGAAAVIMLWHTSGEAGLTLKMGGVFGDFTFIPDGLGVFLSVIATVIGSLAVIFSTSYMKGETQIGRYYAFVLFFIGAMVGLVLTSNIMLMFFFWEITALCSYALIAFHNDDPKAVKGGVKALIITSIGGVGLLLGALILYAYPGSFDIRVFIAAPSAVPAGMLAVLAFGFLIAAAAKSAQFPFQTWLPDAMEAPSPISALIHAATMVNAGVYLLARFYPAFKDVLYWREAVMIVGMLSALLAAIMALTSTDLKRVLAYSTVSQLGYMVYAVGAGGVFASQFHLFSHSIFKALLFLAAGAVIHSVGTRDMTKMGGVGKHMPFVKWVFIIGALALAGIPILNGFWSKEVVLEAGLAGGPSWIYGIMVLVAGMTALYTIRCVWLVFFGEARSDYHAHKVELAMKVALAPLALGALVSWLAVGPFSKLLGEASLPQHHIKSLSIPELIHEVLKLPTLIALVAIAIGVIFWLLRSKLEGFVEGLKSFQWAADHSFGFEAVNSAVVRMTNSLAETLRNTQTGLLNWNVLGILAALIILVAAITLGA
ncbi:MAG: NADH-quinone oxidoreductase subunit L [Anaerolineaceae bacterium]|nr:NADH-quinone oxidoreductase subunit L [Anaerolineaceae bacterium]